MELPWKLKLCRYCLIVHTSIWERIKILSEHHVLYSLKVHSQMNILNSLDIRASHLNVKSVDFKQFLHTSTSEKALFTHKQAFL